MSIDLSSVDSAATAILAGTWGDHSKPTISTITAADGSPTQEGYGVGDTITVVFDQDTNTIANSEVRSARTQYALRISL